MAKEVLEMEVKSNIGEVTKDTDKLTKSTDNAKKGFKGIGTAIKAVGMAFKAAGIGLIIAVFVALKEAVDRNQKAMDLMNTVMTTVSTTFNQVVTVISDVVSWVTESSDRFDGLTKVLSGVMTLALTPLKLAFFGLKIGVQQLMLAWEDSFLGGGDEGKIAELRKDIVGTTNDILEVGQEAIQAGKDVASNIGDAISEVGAIYEVAADGINKISIKGNFEQAKATTAATKAALFAQAEFAKLNAEKLKEAELFRQIRDDETKTFAERIQANKDLKTSLEEQQKLQREQVQIEITAAALLVEQNGNDENKLALKQALNAELELEEAITGQLSEQKTNQVGLEKELSETQNQLRAEGLAGMERELEELQTSYDEKVEMARKAGVDITAITELYEKEQAKIKKEYNTDAVKFSDMSGKQQRKIASDTAGNMANILGKETEAGKAFAITQATIDTYGAAQASYKYMSGIPVVGPALGAIAAAAAIAGGLANVASIRGASSSGPSGSGGGGGAVAAPPAPQMMSGAFDISGGVAPEATKAFVVTDEMSNSQNQLANIRRRATI